MNRTERSKRRREKLRETLKRPWLYYTIATCSAVLLYVLLMHFNGILQVFRYFFNLFTPVIIGLILAYILNPLVNLFKKYVLKKMKREGLKHTFSVLLAVLSFVVAVVGLLILLVPSVIESVRNMYQNFSSYRGNLERYLDNIANVMARMRIDTSRFSNSIEGWFGKFGEMVMNNMDKVLSTSVTVGNGFLNFLIGFVLMIYFLLGRESLLSGVRRLRRAVLTTEKYETHTAFFYRCHRIFIRFIGLNFVDGLIIGVANAIFMLIMRMPLVPFISMLIGVTNLVPTFGPIVGTIAAALLLLLNGHPYMALIFIAFSIVLQTIDSYVIKPKMYGDGFGIQGIWILIAILIFGKLWGLAGMLLAVPLAAIISIVYQEYVLKRAEERHHRKEEKAAEDAGEEKPAEAVSEEGTKPSEERSSEEADPRETVPEGDMEELSEDFSDASVSEDFEKEKWL